MTALVVALGATVLVLGAVVWSGSAGRRRTHYALVAAFLVSLGVAVALAEQVGRQLVFVGLAETVRQAHFVAVTVTLCLLPFLALSGLRLARAVVEDGLRRRHARLARWFVGSVLLTSGLGVAMTLLAGQR